MKLRQRELFIQSFEPFGASFRPRDKTIPSLVSSGPGEAASGKGSLPIMAVDSALGAGNKILAAQSMGLKPVHSRQ